MSDRKGSSPFTRTKQIPFDLIRSGGIICNSIIKLLGWSYDPGPPGSGDIPRCFIAYLLCGKMKLTRVTSVSIIVSK